MYLQAASNNWIIRLETERQEDSILFLQGLLRSFLCVCFRSNPGVKRTLEQMKEDEERIKEVTKAREMKKAMKKKKVKARNGSLTVLL